MQPRRNLQQTKQSLMSCKFTFYGLIFVQYLTHFFLLFFHLDYQLHEQFNTQYVWMATDRCEID